MAKSKPKKKFMIVVKEIIEPTLQDQRFTGLNYPVDEPIIATISVDEVQIIRLLAQVARIREEEYHVR